MTDLTKVLGAVSGVLGVLQAVANTPGINVIPYVSTASSAIAALQAAVTAGINITPYVTAITDTFSGGVPTQAQIDALDAKIAELEALVDAPLPPPEEGEPD